MSEDNGKGETIVGKVKKRMSESSWKKKSDNS